MCKALWRWVRQMRPRERWPWQTVLVVAFLIVGLISGGLASSGVLDASQGVDLQQLYQGSHTSIDCPKAEDVVADIDTTVTTDNRKLLANTTAKITLTGVQPPNPRRDRLATI